MSNVFYQTDADGVLLFVTQPYEYKPGRAVAVEPPAVPAGKLALWDTTIDPNADATFGDAGTGAWVIKDDHRNDDLFTADGKYEIKSDYNGQSYGGIGTLPAWLSLTEPPKPEPTLNDLKVSKLATINATFDSQAAQLTDGYPAGERLTWPIQQAEAQAWGTDNATPTPYLDGLAVARGIDPAEMRQKTLDQTNLFIQASQYLVGTRQRLRDAIDAAADAAAVDEIVWPAA